MKTTTTLSMRVDFPYYEKVQAEAQKSGLAVQDYLLGKLAEADKLKEVNKVLIEGMQVYSKLHYKEMSESDKRKHEHFFRKHKTILAQYYSVTCVFYQKQGQ